jgi:hypothetical protein
MPALFQSNQAIAIGKKTPVFAAAQYRRNGSNWPRENIAGNQPVIATKLR